VVLDSVDRDGMRDHVMAKDGRAQRDVRKAHWRGVDKSEGNAERVDGRKDHVAQEKIRKVGEPEEVWKKWYGWVKGGVSG
jgi:hypothetical protein